MPFTSRLRSESGMTLIELMVAALICSIGTIATIGVIDQSRAVSVKSEKRDAMAHVAEREMERLQELPWSNLAHPEYPTATAVPAGNPSTYITGTSYAYDRATPGATEQLVRSPAPLGQVEVGSTTWDDAQSRISGRIYRYITRVDANARRITVVVTVNGRENPPDLLMSSIKTQPIL